MDLHPPIDDHIKDTVETLLGLHSHHPSFDMRLRTYEEAFSCLRHECSILQSQLCDKDELMSRAVAEAAMNAQAIRKFFEVNRNLAAECADLLALCNNLETEHPLYDQDREALMDFGNQAEDRARDAEARIYELEGEVQRLSGESLLRKHDRENQRDELVRARMLEDEVLESVVTSLIDKGEAASAYAFLEAHSSQEQCKELHQMWDRLRPSTQKVIALAAKLKKLEKDKELCRINLRKAEEKVKLFYRENSALLEENKRLLLHFQRERSHSCSLSRCKSGASAKVRRRIIRSNISLWPVAYCQYEDSSMKDKSCINEFCVSFAVQQAKTKQ